MTSASATFFSFTGETVREYFRPIVSIVSWVRRIAKLPSDIRQQIQNLEGIRFHQERLHHLLSLQAEALQEQQKKTEEELQALQASLLALIREHASTHKQAEISGSGELFDLGDLENMVTDLKSVSDFSTSLSSAVQSTTPLVVHQSEWMKEYVESPLFQVNPNSLQQAADRLSSEWMKELTKLTYVESLPLQVNPDSLQQAVDHLSQALDFLRQQAKKGEAEIHLSFLPTATRVK